MRQEAAAAELYRWRVSLGVRGVWGGFEDVVSEWEAV